jgi:hypothetical protein
MEKLDTTMNELTVDDNDNANDNDTETEIETPVKKKREYVMTEKRKLALDKMRAGRDKKNKEINDKKEYDKLQATTLKKKKKPPILVYESSSDDEEIERIVIKKPKPKKKVAPPPPLPTSLRIDFDEPIKPFRLKRL